MLKQALVINKDLEMGKGKIGVQTGHGCTEYTDYVLNHKDSDMYKRYLEWRCEGMNNRKMMKKAVTKASEEEIKALMVTLSNLNIWHWDVQDFGLTQVSPMSLTCLVVEPLEEEQYQKLFGHLKLL